MTEIDIEMRKNSTSECRIQNAKYRIAYTRRTKDEPDRTVRLHGAYTLLFIKWYWFPGYIDTRMGIAKENHEPILGIRQIVEKSTNISKFVTDHLWGK